MNIVEWTAFLGWCAVINYALLLFSTGFLIFLREWVMDIHNKMLGVDKKYLPRLYFNYLAFPKIKIFFLLSDGFFSEG